MSANVGAIAVVGRCRTPAADFALEVSQAELDRAERWMTAHLQRCRLRAGNTATWLSKLNAARAPYSMPNVTDPGTPAARIDLMFRERAFALFASAHRLGDLRRLVRQYGRSAAATYPTGAYHKDGLTIGSDLQFVIPQTEKNNPKFTGCIDRSA